MEMYFHLRLNSMVILFCSPITVVIDVDRFIVLICTNRVHVIRLCGGVQIISNRIHLALEITILNLRVVLVMHNMIS